MISRYQVLVRRIQVEISDIERTVDTVERHWIRFKTAPTDQDAYLNSVALNLHSFYTGLEP
ncbi:hypothetical protein FJZ31_07585 [Candidatus Poribacteria bacterium]|nr:hypothetical protein [Candidatus Poribacteria bacterium]